MEISEYKQSPRLFWLTMGALLVMVWLLWPALPKCHPGQNAWMVDPATSNPIQVCTQ